MPILIRPKTPTKRSYAALLRFELVALEQREEKVPTAGI